MIDYIVILLIGVCIGYIWGAWSYRKAMWKMIDEEFDKKFNIKDR